MLKYVLLGLLQYGAMSGYDLEQFMNTSTAHFWHAKLSQVYRTLKQMEEKELVSSHIEPQEGRPDRRVYTVTDAGRTEFEQWLSEFITEADEIKHPTLLKTFFMGGASKDHVLAQLQLWQDLYSRQHDYFQNQLILDIKALKPNIPHSENDTLLWNATRRFGELYYEMYVRWLEETCETIENHMRDETD